MNTFEIIENIRINNNIRRFARGNGRSMETFRAMLKMKNDLDKSIERMNKIFNMDQEEMDRIGKRLTGLSTRLSIIDEKAFEIHRGQNDAHVGRFDNLIVVVPKVKCNLPIGSFYNPEKWRKANPRLLDIAAKNNLDKIKNIMSKAFREYGVIENEEEAKSKTDSMGHLRGTRVRNELCTYPRSIFRESRRGIISNMGYDKKVVSTSSFRQQRWSTSQQNIRRPVARRIPKKVRR